MSNFIVSEGTIITREEGTGGEGRRAGGVRVDMLQDGICNFRTVGKCSFRCVEDVEFVIKANFGAFDVAVCFFRGERAKFLESFVMDEIIKPFSEMFVKVAKC